MKQLTPRSDCPISFSLDVLGDKWALLIVRDLVFAGKSTYGEFLQSAEKMATNILANRLAMLESQGFITKEVAADKRSKFTYRLTEKGLDLLPLLLEITRWGAKYSPAGGQVTLLQELAADKEATIQKYRQLVQARNAG
ncbi:winged helix-turn-helix transcriptional regulator [uncultured Hymenobacter sp.]|uniref:winged helix-turn-helix transcriptional regulator n=1 Tax=uncultured Hymenobacter sp. TaxID=170016 RepID=UPI0035CAD995